jgi:hypothetical protein
VSNDRFAAYGAGAGVIAVVLFVVGFIIAPQPPDFDAPAQEVANYFGEDRTRIHVSSAFLVASVPYFLWFLATVTSLTRAGSAGARRTASWAFSCGIVTVTVFLTDVAAVTVAALRPENMAASPELAQALHDYSWLAAAASSLTFAGVFVGFATLVLRDKALWPDWLGWAAVVVALGTMLRLGALFTDEGPFAADGAFGFWIPVVGFLAWTLIGSFVLWLEVRREDEPSGLFGPASKALGRVRDTLPGGGVGGPRA